MGQPTFFFPSNLPSSICRCDKPLEPLSTCPAYSNFLFIIYFVKCNSVCNSVCTRIMTFLLDTLSRGVSNLSRVSFCNTTFQKHLLLGASDYSTSKSHTHNPIQRTRNSSVSSSLY